MKKDTRTYKPELKQLTNAQQDAVNKHALLVDSSESFKLVVEHLTADYINKTLFPANVEEGKATMGITDEYFNGYLAGLKAYYDFMHDRAEIERTPAPTQ